MLALQYWAGLIIMGDTSPVVLEHQRLLIAYMAVGLALTLGLGIAIYIRKRRL